MSEYEILRLLWWALLGVLLIGIAVMDCFDMGSAILLPIVGRTDMERRIVINTVGPVWEGNQVWFILGGGAIFAAWPAIYAVAFSGFYLAMLLLLLSLILRPVGFKYRSKLEGTRWRTTWDTALFLGGLVPALVFGVAFGNVLQGVPFRFDDTLRMTYTGSLFGLFSPFAVLCGLVSVAMITMHGATWLACKTEGAVRQRAQTAGIVAALALAVLFVLGGVWASMLDGYVLQSFAGMDAPSNPLTKHVVHQAGALMNNYAAAPLTVLAPVLGVERGDPHQPVHTALRRQQAEGIAALDEERGRQQTGLLPRCGLFHLDLEPAAFGPARVHAQKHLGPILRVRTTGARVQFHDRVIGIVGTAEETLNFECGEFRFESGDGRGEFIE